MHMVVDYVREMTAKKSYKDGEYGPFEHLLTLCMFAHGMYLDFIYAVCMYMHGRT